MSATKYEYLIHYIPAYHRGELDAAICEEIETAIADCPQFASQLKMGHSLTHLATQTEPFQFKASSFDKFRLTIEKRRWWQVDCPVPVSVITICLVLIISVNFWLPTFETGQSKHLTEAHRNKLNFYVSFDSSASQDEIIRFLGKSCDDFLTLNEKHYIVSFEKGNRSMSENLAILEAFPAIESTHYINH